MTPEDDRAIRQEVERRRQEIQLLEQEAKASMRWGGRLEFVAEAWPGDFIYVPLFVPHQEINASADEQLSCVVIRSDRDRRRP